MNKTPGAKQNTVEALLITIGMPPCIDQLRVLGASYSATGNCYALIMASSSWQKAIARTTPEFIYVKWSIKLSRLLLTLACGQIVGYLVRRQLAQPMPVNSPEAATGSSLAKFVNSDL